MLRLAKCCRPVPGDEIVGYISLGRGITIHRERLPQRGAAAPRPRALHERRLGRRARRPAFMVEIQIDAWDRHRLLEDLSRAFSESGANIVEARCLSSPPMVKNRFVVEVADTHTLKGAITRLRNIESVFDAYRVTPGGAPRSALRHPATPPSQTASAPGVGSALGTRDPPTPRLPARPADRVAPPAPRDSAYATLQRARQDRVARLDASPR